MVFAFAPGLVGSGSSLPRLVPFRTFGSHFSPPFCLRAASFTPFVRVHTHHAHPRTLLPLPHRIGSRALFTLRALRVYFAHRAALRYCAVLRVYRATLSPHPYSLPIFAAVRSHHRFCATLLLPGFFTIFFFLTTGWFPSFAFTTRFFALLRSWDTTACFETRLFPPLCSQRHDFSPPPPPNMVSTPFLFLPFGSPHPHYLPT